MRVGQPMAQAVMVCAMIGLGFMAASEPSRSGYTDYRSAAAAAAHVAPTQKIAEPSAPAPRPVAKPAEAAPSGPREHVVRVSKGDTLMDILVKDGVPRPEAFAAIETLKEVFDPRTLKAGQDVTLTLRPLGTPPLQPAAGPDGAETADPAPRLLALRLEPAFDRSVGVDRTAGGDLRPVETQKEFETEVVRAGGTIESSLFQTADEASVPPQVLVEMIRAFSFDVDFQRDIQPGDSFEIAYERLADEKGRVARNGDVLYASLTLSGDRYDIYRYELADGEVDFFTEKGESVRKALMRTPVDGARLSSRYGKRKHPILGYTRMHRGIDFAAPKGTPVFAAGNGTVAKAGRNGNYGNYVEIRHGTEFVTAYAHLSRFAKGVRTGARVKQGEVIAYVGASGLATGPHLHFELSRRGTKVNPLSVKLPSGRKLKGEELERFEIARAEIDRKIAGLPMETKVASNR